MARVIDATAAVRVLEAAARAARKPAGVSDQLQRLWEDRTREAFTWTGNKTAVAALGTALLAKATDGKVDALSLAPSSGNNGYSARTLCRTVLATHRASYGYVLGTGAGDPLANSPWFGGDARIDLITKWRPSMRAPAAELVSWLSGLTAAEALDALTGFLRVCMEEQTRQAASREASQVTGVVPSIDALCSALEPMMRADPEEGRLGAAIAAACWSAAGHPVDARVVNAPGQTDIDVLLPRGGVNVGVEVKQKKATAQDALDIAAGTAAVGASKAVLAALANDQDELDHHSLVAKAEAQSGVVLDFDYSVSDMLRRGIFSSSMSRAEYLERFAEELASWLNKLEVTEAVRLRWKSIVDRWADEATSQS